MSTPESESEDEFDGVGLPCLQPREHKDAFDPQEYLKAFYKTTSEDCAMQLILFFLPGFAHIMPKNATLLDVGSGPTVHVAMALRRKVDSIYLSDFASQNREVLRKWWQRNESQDSFQWTNVINCLASIEAELDCGLSMESETRSKLKAIAECDVHCEGVLLGTHYPENETCPSSFDIVSTIFCLEYASANSAEYRTALKNVCSLVSPGGFLLMGGVTRARSYHFGSSRFLCHYLRISEVRECLEEESLSQLKFIEHGGIFLLLAQKNIAAGGAGTDTAPGPCEVAQLERGDRELV